MSTYSQDRDLWNRNVDEKPALEVKPWRFSENSVLMGDERVCIDSSLLAVFAMFDVFCSSTVMRRVGNDARLQAYYCSLQNHIADEVQSTRKGATLARCPCCILPWLWRTVLGFFRHDDSDDRAMKDLCGGVEIYDTPFPIHCMFSFKSRRRVEMNM